jgi:hypothetical protein
MVLRSFVDIQIVEKNEDIQIVDKKMKASKLATQKLDIVSWPTLR